MAALPVKLYVRECHGRFARWMLSRGWGGVTLPIPFVGWTVILTWGEPSPELIAHELGHYRQATKMGACRWWACYLWLWMRHGYERHPMERSLDP